MTEPTPSSVREGKRRRRVFDTLNEGVVVQDTDGVVRDWNAPALGMFGLTPDQLCGRAPLNNRWHVTWEDRKPVGTEYPIQAVLRRAFERGTVTVTVRKADGATVWIAISSHMVGADDDIPEATIVSTMTDVTAHHEMALENARYRDIIDTLDASYRILEESPIGMCSVDAEGNVLRNNMAFLALGGGETTSIMPLVPEDDRATLRDAFARLLDGRTASVRIETRIRRPDGTATWCELTAVAMRQGLPDAAILLLANDVTERRRREARLRQLAERDPLTGLHNRRSFVRVLRERLTALQQPSRRPGATWTLMLIDLDGFKDVNDTLGHAGGDAVLVAVAAGIRDRTRVDDAVGRLGGDEFAVLLQTHEADHAIAIGNEIIARVEEAAASVEGAPPVSASIGIVHLRAGRGADATLAAADSAMYDAKRAGKARCVDAGSR
jgi:diguanylate cyclase (GGDEF)-like protein/PAS domain S-box-containing protein